MTFDEYRILVNKLWWSNGVNLIGLGEQLLHPDIVKVIHWTTQTKKLSAVLSTNGMVNLDKRGLAEALLTLKQVQFSIDTTDADLLHEIRVGADFAVIDRNLRYFLEMKRQHNSKLIVNINAVLTAKTLPTITQLIQYAESLEGLDYLQLNSVTLDEYQQAHKPLFGNQAASSSSYIQEAIEYARRRTLALARNDRALSQLLPSTKRPIILGLVPNKILARPTGWQQCRSIYSGIGFRPNGDMYLCCYKPDLVVGNGFRDDILEAWNGLAARKFRGQVLTDSPPRCCHGCNFAYEGTYPTWTPKSPSE